MGIPEGFPGIGGLIVNWFHEFVGSTLIEHAKGLAARITLTMKTSLVALGGLFLGWFVYKNVPAGAQDPLARALGPVYALLKNKYYMDELYDFLFVRPSYWISRNFSYLWMDRRVIDGTIHLFGRVSVAIGSFLRNYIDIPIVNGFGDFVGEGTKRVGRALRVIQTGRVQQYMIGALITIAAFSVLFYYLLAFDP